MPDCRYVEDNGLAVMLAAKRLAGVTPELNLIDHVKDMPLPSANKAAHYGFETQRRCLQKSTRGVTVAPKKNFVLYLFLKKSPVKMAI